MCLRINSSTAARKPHAALPSHPGISVSTAMQQRASCCIDRINSDFHSQICAAIENLLKARVLFVATFLHPYIHSRFDMETINFFDCA